MFNLATTTAGLLIGLQGLLGGLGGEDTFGLSTFLSIQTGSSPTNGDVLQTDGSLSTWVATSTLGLGDGTFTGLSDTMNSFTAGSILFSTATEVSEDNANLFWDDTNNRLGIGTASPDANLEVLGSSFPVGSFKRYTTAIGGGFGETAGVGSGYSLRTISSGDMVDGFGGGLVFSIEDDSSSTAISDNIIGRIYARRDGADNKGALQFFTFSNDANFPTMTLRSTGRVGILNSSPDYVLDVTGGSLGSRIQGTAYPTLQVLRTSSGTDTPSSGMNIYSKTDQNMSDGFGGGIIYSIGDSGVDNSIVATIYGLRDGADNSGALAFNTYTAGSRQEGLRIDSSQNVGMGISSPTARLHVVGDADTEQLIVKANSTQNDAIARIEDSSSDALFEFYDDATRLAEMHIEDVLFLHTGGSVTNTFLGNVAGASNTGTLSVGIGFNALAVNEASNNVAVGYRAGELNTTGDENFFIGRSAGSINTEGQRNVYLGDQAGRYAGATVSNNVAIGRSAGSNVTGSENTIIGGDAGNFGGDRNTVVGFKSGVGAGDRNTFLGYRAGNTSGANRSVYIGYTAGETASTDDRLIIENSNDIVTPLIYGEFNNDIVNINGSLGVGTTSPYAKLSVVGETVAEYFTATSTTATTTLAGGFNVGTGGLVYDYSSGNVGIGTASPTSLLAVNGDITGDQYYCEMYAKSNGNALGITAVDTYATSTQNVTSGLLNGCTHASGVMTITNDGTYSVWASVGMNGGNNKEYHIAIGINGVDQDKCHMPRKMGGGGDSGSATLNCLLDLNAGDEISLMIENVTDDTDVTVNDSNVMLRYIGRPQ